MRAEPEQPLTRRELVRRRSSDRRRRRLVRLAVVVSLVALLAGLGVGYMRSYFAPGAVGQLVDVTIPEGATLSEIGLLLEEKGVVKHASRFVADVERDGLSTDLKAGTYKLHVHEPYERLVAALTKGAQAAEAKVTIPEGATLAQIASRVAAAAEGITEKEYVAAARTDPPPLNLKGYKAGSSLEGMLFPATYAVPKSLTARALVEQQLDAFTSAFDGINLNRAAGANLTPYEVVIIASMIEREAQVPAERPLVAAVIWNRLHDGMRLQIDATIQYALGETKPELTYDDLKVESPYNTYLHDGLPPTPIANPGLAALKAAAAPANVDYLYYVARNDGTGRHYFSRTYEQFLSDKAKANAK